MIDPKELKIGNYVCKTDNPQLLLKHNFNPYIHVESISRTGVNAVTIYDEDMDSEGLDYTPGIDELQFEQLHPIPLTPEILISMGLQQRSHTWRDGSISENYFWYRKYNIGITEKDGTFLGREAYDGSPQWIAGIEYVHQLQNIYFALTGEELKMEL